MHPLHEWYACGTMLAMSVIFFHIALLQQCLFVNNKPIDTNDSNASATHTMRDVLLSKSVPHVCIKHVDYVGDLAERL